MLNRSSSPYLYSLGMRGIIPDLVYFLPLRMFGIVAKGTQSGMENVCHVFAEFDPLQPFNQAIDVIQGAIAKP